MRPSCQVFITRLWMPGDRWKLITPVININDRKTSGLLSGTHCFEQQQHFVFYLSNYTVCFFPSFSLSLHLARSSHLVMSSARTDESIIMTIFGKHHRSVHWLPQWKTNCHRNKTNGFTRKMMYTIEYRRTERNGQKKEEPWTKTTTPIDFEMVYRNGWVIRWLSRNYQRVQPIIYRNIFICTRTRSPQRFGARLVKRSMSDHRLWNVNLFREIEGKNTKNSHHFDSWEFRFFFLSFLNSITYSSTYLNYCVHKIACLAAFYLTNRAQKQQNVL